MPDTRTMLRNIKDARRHPVTMKSKMKTTYTPEARAILAAITEKKA